MGLYRCCSFQLVGLRWVLVIGGGLLVFYYVLVDWYEGFLNYIMILVVIQGISLMVCDSAVALAATIITMSGVAFHFF